MTVGAVAVLGLTALLAASPTAYLIVKTLGVDLVWLGVQALRPPTLAPPSLHGASGLVVLVLIQCLLTLGWLSAYAYALTRARTIFERPRIRRALDRVTGVVLITFALRLATDRA